MLSATKKFLATVAVLSTWALTAHATGPIKGRDLMTATAKNENLALQAEADKQITVAPGELGTVVIFLSSHCPCSDSHVALVKDLVRDFSKFSFVAVHSNEDENLAEAQNYFRGVNLGMPIIQDQQAKLADEFRALKTPHAFVIGKNGQVLYRGGITSSNYGPSADRAYLRDALNDIVLNRTVRQPEGRTLGCLISRTTRSL